MLMRKICLYVRTLLWKAFFILLMLATLVLLPFLLLTKLFLPRPAFRRLVYLVASAWGRITIWSTGSRVRVSGRELLPQHGRLCFIGNHQSLFDIPAFLGHIGRPVGFIAKKELLRIPVLSHWMMQMPCVFLDRRNARQARESFQHSAQIIARGFPQVIFPEGGRSGTEAMRPFHPGSFKLAQMAGADIVPFAISGTWNIMERDGNIHASDISLRILPPITPEDPLYRDKTGLVNAVQAMIQSELLKS